MMRHGLTRMALTFLLVAAAANIAAGVFLAGQPERARDLRTVKDWSGRWLTTGEDIYAAPSRVDYPPQAIVALSPLSLLPDGFVVPLWAAFNIGLALVAPYLAARVVSPLASSTSVTTLSLLFLCWSGTKTLLQFSLLVLVLGLAAVRLADKRPRWSALCLGLATMKPQIAAPFFLWALFERRSRLMVESLMVAVAAALVYCVRSAVNPVDVAVQYAQTLAALYSGKSAMTGASELGPLLARLADDRLVDVISAATATLSLALVGASGLASRKGRRRTLFAGLGLGAVWSLLTFRHLTYGFVILLPAAAWLSFGGHDEGEVVGTPESTEAAKVTRLRTMTYFVLQGLLIVDVPGVWRRIGSRFPRSPLDLIMTDFDRLLMLTLFVAFFVISRRTNPVYHKGHI